MGWELYLTGDIVLNPLHLMDAIREGLGFLKTENTQVAVLCLGVDDTSPNSFLWDVW